MASVDRRAENRINATLLPNPGPYLARIVNNVDPMKQGALEVELLRPVGNQKEVGGQLFNVRYLSPFYGVTPLDVTGTDPVEFNDTQKSYGFWAVPPDVGVTVMVIFVDSDPGQGFWIGCVQDALMNYMIPGIASSSNFQDRVRGNSDIEWEEVEETKKRYGEEIEYLPVGEINRRIFKQGGNNAPTPNSDVEANKKPVHPLAERLLIQGLEKDMARGHTTSSARRESPSNVYGWSTPGPIDKRKGAKLGKIGKVNDKIDRFVSRMGGHCIIMDDGNDRFLRKTRPWEGGPEYADLEAGEEGLVDFPYDEQIRIRTRKGAQILLHSSEDLIYITNSRGTAWMEFTSKGKIIMYAEDGIEQASGGDISLTSRRDMHFDIGRDHNKKVAANSNEKVGATKTAHVQGTYFQHAEGDLAQSTGNNLYQHAAYSSDVRSQSFNMTGTSINWAVGGNLLIDCSGKNFEVLASNIALTGTNDVHLHAATDLRLKASHLDFHAGDGYLMATATAGIIVKSDGIIATESASTTSMNAGAQMQLTSKDAMSISSTGDAIKLTAEATINLGAKGNIVQKGAKIYLNGPDPAAAAPAKKGLDKAKEAVPAAPAGAAATPSSAGGGQEFPVDLANYVFPSDAGGTLSAIAPGRQPYSWAENQNPAVSHQANFDARQMSKEYPSGKKYNFGRMTDFDNVPFNDGGGSDGTINVGHRFGSGHLPNVGKSYTSVPLHKDYLSRHPMDWTKDQEFLSKAGQVASSLGVEKEDLLAVFAIESTKSMNPSIRSPGGTRVGLIQMGNKEAKEVGTTTAKLRNMSRAEQLDYVQKYFQSKGSINGLGSLYLAVAAPAKANIPDNQEVYKRGSKAWHQNPLWRENGPGGKITKKSIAAAVERYKDWVKAALGSGQNNSAQQAGQGPRPAQSQSPASSSRQPGIPTTNIPSRYNPSSSGTNVPFLRTDGSGEQNT